MVVVFWEGKRGTGWFCLWGVDRGLTLEWAGIVFGPKEVGWAVGVFGFRFGLDNNNNKESVWYLKHRDQKCKI